MDRTTLSIRLVALGRDLRDQPPSYTSFKLLVSPEAGGDTCGPLATPPMTDFRTPFDST